MCVYTAVRDQSLGCSQAEAVKRCFTYLLGCMFVSMSEKEISRRQRRRWRENTAQLRILRHLKMERPPKEKTFGTRQNNRVVSIIICRQSLDFGKPFTLESDSGVAAAAQESGG